MIELKTTKLEEEFNKFIIKWTGSMSGHLLDDDENDGERFRELLREQVGLDELKKDLTEIRHTLNQGKLQKAKVLVNNLDSELDLCLCNSQEQTRKSMVDEGSRNLPVSSVSCEHAGEGIKKNTEGFANQSGSESSPVQNHQWFCGGKEPCACMDSWKESQNSKKCTCKTPIYMYENNLKQDKIFCLNCKKEIGGRCGSEL